MIPGKFRKMEIVDFNLFYPPDSLTQRTHTVCGVFRNSKKHAGLTFHLILLQYIHDFSVSFCKIPFSEGKISRGVSLKMIFDRKEWKLGVLSARNEFFRTFYVGIGGNIFYLDVLSSYPLMWKNIFSHTGIIWLENFNT